MTKYEFTLILRGTLELTEELADALYEAGCDDGTPGTCNGVFSIDFHREADSLESALRSAIAHVKSQAEATSPKARSTVGGILEV